MEKTTLSWNSLDTIASIDTYATFTTDLVEEQLIEMYCEDNGVEGLDYDSFERHYDMKGYTSHLADCSIQVLKNNLDENVIYDIRKCKIFSPKYYNYTTDSYDMEVDVNEEELLRFCKESGDDFKQHLEENWRNEIDDEDDVNYMYGCLDYYIRCHIDSSDYLMEMFDEVQAYEYVGLKIAGVDE